MTKQYNKQKSIILIFLTPDYPTIKQNRGDLVCTALVSKLSIRSITYRTSLTLHAVVVTVFYRSAEASLPIKAKAAIGERHETWEGGLRVLADFNIWFKILWVKVF